MRPIKIGVKITAHVIVKLRRDFLALYLTEHTRKSLVYCVSCVAEVSCPSPTSEKLYLDSEVIGERSCEIIRGVEFESEMSILIDLFSKGIISNWKVYWGSNIL